jgi:predicted subunit of tRNA(5-methylaminomethyl-2-thiouridylate) methyltransferase
MSYETRKAVLDTAVEAAKILNFDHPDQVLRLARQFLEFSHADFSVELISEKIRLKKINAELLEALIDMVQAYSELFPRDQIPTSCGRQAIRKADAAIAKAKGETK